MSAGSSAKELVCHTRRKYSAAPTPRTTCIQRARQIRFSDRIGSNPKRSARPPAGPVRIEQPMQMDDEIAHLSVVDRLLRLRLPGRIGGRVAGIDADDIETVDVLELG